MMTNSRAGSHCQDHLLTSLLILSRSMSLAVSMLQILRLRTGRLLRVEHRITVPSSGIVQTSNSVNKGH